MFGHMLFAENTKDGFKIISRYDWVNAWDIPDDADKNNEMSCWKLSDGEHIRDRGTWPRSGTGSLERRSEKGILYGAVSEINLPCHPSIALLL
jgi:hypothetical protein